VVINDDADEIDMMPVPSALRQLHIARDEYDEAEAQHQYAEQRLMFWKMRLTDLERNMAQLRARLLSEVEGADV